ASLAKRHLTVGAARRSGGAGDRPAARTRGIRAGHAGAARLVAPAEPFLDRLCIVGARAGRHTATGPGIAHRTRLALRVHGARGVGDTRRPGGVAVEASAAILVGSAETSLGAGAVGTETARGALRVPGARDTWRRARTARARVGGPGAPSVRRVTKIELATCE